VVEKRKIVTGNYLHSKRGGKGQGEYHRDGGGIVRGGCEETRGEGPKYLFGSLRTRTGITERRITGLRKGKESKKKSVYQKKILSHFLKVQQRAAKRIW